MSSTPTDGTMGVARDVRFAATFSTPPLPSTITAANVQLLGPQGNLIPSTASVNGTALELTPLFGRLPGAAAYAVRLSPTITDTNGQTLTPPYTRAFATARQTWSTTASDLASLPYFTGGTIPTVAADEAGNVVAVWQVRIADQEILFARRANSNGVWGATAVIRAGPTFGLIYSVDVRFGADGNAYVSWIESDSTGAKFYLARESATSVAWSAPEEVPSGSFALGSARLIVDLLGNVTVVATSIDQLLVTRMNATTGTWSPPTTIAVNDYIINVRAVVDRSGNVTATWSQNDVGGRSLYSTRYNIDNGTWNPAQLIRSSMLGGSGNYASLGVDATGAVAMTWSRDGGLVDNFSVEASRFNPAAGTWMPAVRLDSSALGAFTPGIAVDAAGYSTAAWRQDDGLYYSRLAPGSVSWSAPQAIPGSIGSRTDEPMMMTVDDAGNVVLVISLDSGVTAFHYDLSGGRWSAPVLIGNPAAGTTQFSNAPILAIDRTGTLTAVWFTQRSVGGVPLYFVTSNRFN